MRKKGGGYMLNDTKEFKELSKKCSQMIHEYTKDVRNFFEISKQLSYEQMQIESQKLTKQKETVVKSKC